MSTMLIRPTAASSDCLATTKLVGIAAAGYALAGVRTGYCFTFLRLGAAARDAAAAPLAPGATDLPRLGMLDWAAAAPLALFMLVLTSVEAPLPGFFL